MVALPASFPLKHPLKHGTHPTHRTTLVVSSLLCLGMLGCSRNDPAAGVRGAQVNPVAPAVVVSGAPEAVGRKAADEILLDLARDGSALVGRVEPAPVDTDGDRVMVVRLLGADGRDALVQGGQPVVEVRFTRGAYPLLVLDTEHTLSRIAAPGATAESLATTVYGPLSLSLDGQTVAYTRGEAPMLEVVRHNLATGAVVAVAPGIVPAWSPALSPDGREVIFVASSDGRPEYWRAMEGAEARRWQEVGAGVPFPTGPSAPVVYGDTLVFEDEAGVHSLGLDGTLRRSLPGVHNPVRNPQRTALLAGTTTTATTLTRIDAQLLTGAPQ